MKKCIFYIIILILMLLPAIACADLYKYTEDSGTVVISNDIKRVPAKYKDTLVIIREDSNSSAQQTPSTSSTPPKLADEDNKNTTESLTNSITNILKKNNKQGSPDIAELKDSKLNDLSGMVGKDLNKMIYLIGFSIIGSIVSIFVVR
ncbi:MAG: hypothetical protein HQK93_00050 [Nitrospirae bacterium]|nr:hypothetical protein [Nitrospirota bacterium]